MKSEKLYPIDHARNFLRSMYGRAAVVIAALVFLWRFGYADSSQSSFGLWEARGSWDLAHMMHRRLARLQYVWTDIAEAAIETAIIMAAIVALLLAVRWVLRAKP